MIEYQEYKLPNGLHLIVHTDTNCQTVVLNTLYKVGSRNENPNKTGFAHLFEHLMFGGSANIPAFDEPLQAVGGDNNAFTNTDITNYYTIVPANNVETAFWLESDRMMALSFDPEVLEVQRNVVIEEYKQRYLNQPYGDSWLRIRPLAYKVHPYQWATIGKSIDHIAEATMDDVRHFFFRYYVPSNAILVVAGNITFEKACSLAEKWYGEIPAGTNPMDVIPQEPKREKADFELVKSDVPQDAIYKSFHMVGRADKLYTPTDLLSDILGNGKSSYLHQKLVKDRHIFSQIGAYVSGSVDPGLLHVSGKVQQGVSLTEAEMALSNAIDDFIQRGIEQEELNRVKNLAASTLAFGEVEILNKAMSLAFAAFLGNTSKANEELDRIMEVRLSDIQEAAAQVLRSSNSCTLHYQSTKG